MANAVLEASEHPVPVEHHASGPQRLTEFLKETRQEMSKVVTPTRDEVKNNTLVVVGTVFFFAAFFWAIDMTAGRGLDKLLLKLASH